MKKLRSASGAILTFLLVYNAPNFCAWVGIVRLGLKVARVGGAAKSEK